MDLIAHAPTPEEVGEELGRTWKWLLAAAIVAIVLGLVAIFVPMVASVAVTALVGWLLLIGGVIGAIEAVRMRAAHSAWRLVLRLLLMVLYVVAGLWLIVSPWEGTIALTAVLVAYLWVDGVFRIAMGLSERGSPGAWLLILGGALGIVLGILIWTDLPSSSGWAIGLLVGINLLFWGWGMLTAALAGRAIAKQFEGSSMTPRPA
jgi:uncharacterized membrane protein HdeD (DUF308 family)